MIQESKRKAIWKSKILKNKSKHSDLKDAQHYPRLQVTLDQPQFDMRLVDWCKIPVAHKVFAICVLFNLVS